MPKISPDRLERNRAALEQAALRCFVRYGYHGVSIRTIAKTAGVSLGNLYTYFPDKLSLFSGVLERLSGDFIRSENAFTRYLRGCNFPNDLELMGAAVAQNVDRYRDYLKMVYIDVVEFDGRHIREIFSHLDRKFDAVLGDRFRALGGLGPRRSIDPAFAFIAIYMSFYQYFILTRLFGAKGTYGDRSDREVVADLARLFLGGMARSGRRRSRR
jgi:AcrR family transcriptional regulator